MSLEDETAAIKRLVERGEARAGHLESHHGKASIVIDKHDLDAMRDIKARLEGKAAPGDTAEREADWFAIFCRKYVQRSDARQKESGLQYTEAETHDLAKECARHEAAALAAADRELQEVIAANARWTVKCQNMMAEIERLTTAEDGARRAALEDAVQIALAYRDEADAGQHPDKGDPHHSLGQGYAANIIADRLCALASKATPGEGGTNG